MKKINPLIQWWMTPKLPPHDINELPLLIDKSKLAKYRHIFSRWVIHPVKRRLARIYLVFLKKFTGIKVIGITGSAGKTTTKEMLYAILKTDGKTVCTKTFIDPVYNIPNTILKTPVGTKYLILEMGVEYPGEMDFYLWLAKPDVGVITNIFPTHTEFFGDADGVLKEKRKLFDRVQTAVLCRGDKRLSVLKKDGTGKIYWFKDGQDPFVSNANAAGKTAEALGITEAQIEKGIKNYTEQPHRLKVIRHKSGAVILDDSYNSNPEAVIAALRYFIKMAGSGKKVAVLGNMLELGEIAVGEHKRIGAELKKYNFDYVLGVGNLAKYFGSDTAPNYKGVLPKLSKYLKPNYFIFIKGSRSIGLDRVVDQLS